MVQWQLLLLKTIDILIIALFIYSLLLFFRRTRSFTVFIGLAITVGLYILAKVLRLQLTLIALQYFVGASVVVFAVIFQSEIRKYIELLGLIGERQIKVGKQKGKSPETTELVRACVTMAQNKIGALLVLQGKDELEPYIEGGVPLDGLISEEIILSVFEPGTEGHDGAMVITNNRIFKFAAHLPLSINFKEIGKHGTRHSAGLGLSENVDAISIVISEEKGTVSVCRDGKLKVLTEPIDLERELDKFIKAKFVVQRETAVVSHFIKHNFRLKLSALIIAILLWILKNS